MSIENVIRWRGLFPILLVILLSAAFVIPQETAHAANYTPGCSATDLIDAINSANTDGEASTISLVALCTYTLTTPQSTTNTVFNGTPVIVNDGTLTINGNGATIERSSAGGTPNFRLLSIDVGATVAISNVTLSNGKTNGEGGAFRNVGTITLMNSRILNNTSTGFYNEGTVTLINSTVSGNAGFDGGGFYTHDGHVTIINSTISGNHAQNGGGFYNAFIVTLINSTIANNTAVSNGGGIFNLGDVTATNVTISGNSATSINVNGADNIDNRFLMTFYNSIVANGAHGRDCDNSAMVQGSHNLFETPCGEANQMTNTITNLDPMLDPAGLQNNGGPTQTIALLSNSAAIDAGSNQQATSAGIASDQTGNPRFFDDANVPDTGSGSAPIVDLGAVERQNNSILPSVSVGDATVNEGNSGTTNLTFTLSLSSISGHAVSVNYFTADGSAVDGSDYTAVPSTQVTIPAGQSSAQVAVSANGDSMYELHEVFFLYIESPVNAVIADNPGVGRIDNDDAQPSISVGNVIQSEGNSGTSDYNFTVTLSAPSYQTVALDYFTANGSAVAGSDYTAVNSTLSFAPGETSKQIVVSVSGDTMFELNEVFVLYLVNASNATFSNSVGLGRINNDDSAPRISINDVTLAEGNSGTTAFTFTLSLTNASYKSISASYVTGSGSATEPGDYTALALTQVTFAPGETSKQVTVLVNGDPTYEANETFVVNLSSPTNATIDDAQGVGTIADDDGQPVISVNDVSRTEGGTGVQTNMPFTVTLSNPSDQTITVQFATSDGTATTADGDYTALNLTTLSFAPGVTSRNVTVKITGDIKHEAHETLNFNLSNPTNASIGDALGIGTIVNDDSKPTITVSDVSRAEGNSGTSNFPFVITLSHPSYQTIMVSFTTSDGTATAGTDYTLRSGSLSFAPGVTSRTVTVVGNGDTIVEPNETFNFNLSSPSNASIGDALGIGTITNDDTAGLVAPLNLSAFAASLTEGQSTTYTIALNAAPADLLGVDSLSVQMSFDAAYLSVTPALLSFDASNWNAPQTVTVTAVDDAQALQPSISLPILHTLTAGDVTLNGAPFGVTITDNDALLVPVAPELPQIEAVSPVSPDAPNAEVPGVVLVSPVRETSENPVAFTWIGTADAAEYRVLVQQQSDRSVVMDITVSAGTCNGNICVFVSGFSPQFGVGYVWTVTPITARGAGVPSAEAGFSYSPSAPDGIELPGTVIGG